MDASTRPSSKRRQERAHKLRHLTALSFFVLALCPPTGLVAAPSIEPLPAPETVSSIAQDTAHEAAIRNVEIGNETLSLSARLSSASTTLAEDVSWEIRLPSGEVVLKGNHTELSTKIEPGEIIVEARYGAVNVRETLTVLEGHALTVNFVLNAGGLRVLPLIKDMPEAGLDSHTLIYALSGPGKGKLVSHSRTAGEILKLAAGHYRVESRLGKGNAIAVADVRVRPGRISAIDVKHQAGLARLSFVGSAEAIVDWRISLVGGAEITKTSGLNHALALRPGVYLAEAKVNGEILTAQFKIDAGQERDILLGN